MSKCHVVTLFLYFFWPDALDALSALSDSLIYNINSRIYETYIIKNKSTRCTFIFAPKSLFSMSFHQIFNINDLKSQTAPSAPSRHNVCTERKFHFWPLNHCFSCLFTRIFVIYPHFFICTKWTRCSKELWKTLTTWHFDNKRYKWP